MKEKKKSRRVKKPPEEKYPGYAEGRQGILYGFIAIATCWFPFAGIVLGYFAMRHGEKSRKLGSHLHGSLGLMAILLGGLGFFLGLLDVAGVFTVWFLNATNIIELGAL